MYGSKNLKPEQQAKLTKGHEKNLRLFHAKGVDQGKYKSPKKQEKERRCGIPHKRVRALTPTKLAVSVCPEFLYPIEENQFTTPFAW